MERRAFKSVRGNGRSCAPARPPECEAVLGPLSGGTKGRYFGFSLTCANPPAGHGLGRKMGSEKKLVRTRRSLIIHVLDLIGRGLKTAGEG